MSDGSPQVTVVDLAHEGFQEGVRMILAGTANHNFFLWKREALEKFIPQLGPDGQVSDAWLDDFCQRFRYLSGGRCTLSLLQVANTPPGVVYLDIAYQGTTRTLMLQDDLENPASICSSR